ncbi:MAG: ABC transporter permease subunit [Acidimicrobiaceae bacterium]|nr:ABC transporter permease subunit [Acidimicrobiaceae bacterium]
MFDRFFGFLFCDVRRLLLARLVRVDNPALVLELSRWCRSRLFVVSVMGVYVSCCFASGFFYFVGPYSSFHHTTDYFTMPIIVMVFVVVPPFGATSIAGERRSRTLVPIQLSLLRPFDIVWGKVVASVVPILFPALVFAFTAYLKDSGFPFFDVVLFFDVVFWLVMVVAVAFAVASVSVLISTFAKSSAAAVSLIYGIFCLLLVLFLRDPIYYY